MTVATRTALLFVVLALASVAPAAAQGALKPVDALIVNSNEDPVPVDVVNPISVNVLNTGVPGEPFTLPPKQLSAAFAGGNIAPDPSGTQYALASVTVSNPTAEAVSVRLRSVAIGGVSNNSCSFVFNQEDTTDGPEIRVPANDTVQLSFAQPFITAPVTGTFVCLVASGDPAFIGVKWSAVGYKILP